MAHLSICTSSSDPFFQDPRFHAYLWCCAVSQLRKFIRKNFLKSMWWMKVGCRVNRSQAFPLYLNHIQLLLPRSDSGDPVQGVDVSFMTLPFWWSSALSFFPHLVISGEEQVLDSGCHLAFSLGANALLQPCRVIEPVTWGMSWGFTHPQGGMCNRLWWEGSLQDWAAQQFFCTWCDVYKHGLLSCSLRVRTWRLCLLCPFPPWQEGRLRAEKQQRAEFWPQLCHLPAETLDTSVTFLGLWRFCNKMGTFGQKVFKRFYCHSEMLPMTLIERGKQDL